MLIVVPANLLTPVAGFANSVKLSLSVNALAVRRDRVDEALMHLRHASLEKHLHA